jgi:hypothetical protein
MHAWLVRFTSLLEALVYIGMDITVWIMYAWLVPFMSLLEALVYIGMDITVW